MFNTDQADDQVAFPTLGGLLAMSGVVLLCMGAAGFMLGVALLIVGQVIALGVAIAYWAVRRVRLMGELRRHAVMHAAMKPRLSGDRTRHTDGLGRVPRLAST